MHIDEFIYMYKKSNRNLEVDKETMENLRIQFHEHQEKWKEKSNKIVKAIFGDKAPKIPALFNEDQEYNLLIFEKDNFFQVEIFNADTNRIESVNAGFGDILFNKSEKEQFIQTFGRFCHIKEMHHQTVSRNRLPFHFSEKPNRWILYTSKIRYESKSKTILADSIDAQLMTQKDFETWIFNVLSKETKQAMDFFEVSVDIDKMFTPESRKYFISKDSNQIFELNTSIKNKGLYFIEFRQKSEKEIHYEYK